MGLSLAREPGTSLVWDAGKNLLRLGRRGAVERQRQAPGSVVHVGWLAVCGGGGRIVLACFTEGLCYYSLASPHQERHPEAGSCRLAAVGYLGGPILTAGMENSLSLHRGTGGRDELILSG